MQNINLSQESYVSYDGVYFMNACNVVNPKFTLKLAPKTENNPTAAVLVHVSGTQKTSGVIVDFDMWPRDNATEEDLKALFDENGTPKASLDNIEFRIGYWPEIDAEGNKVLREGKPKWYALSIGGSPKKLHGEKRQFVER